MPVFHIERNEGYTVMSNFHLRDKSLSLKSKGLLSQMLSLPEEWDYTLKGLSAINRESVDAIRSAINELESAGYVVRKQKRDSSGKMASNEYFIYEKPDASRKDNAPMLEKSVSRKPMPNKPISENPTTVNPITENSTQLITKEKNKYQSNKEIINHPSINHDRMDSMDVYRWIVYEKIGYDALVEQQNYSKDQIDEIVEIMLESICSTAPTQRIGKEDIPTEVVKSRFLKVDSSHIEYIFNSMKENTTDVRNIKAYLKTVIYNAPVTIGNYYAAKVNHDLYGTD